MNEAAQVEPKLEKGQNQNIEFRKLVEESQAKLNTVIIPPKRGPGRPRKAAPELQKTESVSVQPAVAVEPPPDISPFLEAPIIAVSKIPANKYRIPELAFDAEEAKACAQSLNSLLNAFLPNVNQMSPKTAAVLSTCTVFGSIAFAKYQIYHEKKTAMMNAIEAEAEKEQVKSNSGEYFQTQPMGPKVAAEQAFRRAQ